MLEMARDTFLDLLKEQLIELAELVLSLTELVLSLTEF